MDLLFAALGAIAAVVAVYAVLAVSVAYAPAAKNLLSRAFDRVTHVVLAPLRAKVGGGWAAYGYGSPPSPRSPRTARDDGAPRTPRG
jgi:hypothetical protein